MSFRVAAARLLSAVAVMLPLAASAADLDDEAEYRTGPRTESPYDDPRYRYLYEDNAPTRHYGQPQPDYRPYPPSAKDDGYLPTVPLPPRYTQAPRYERHAPGCLPRAEIRARLLDRGWSGFHDIDLRGPLAYVKAQRPSGRTFDLEVDRCTGSIMSARPVDVPERPYAWRGPSHRY
jgi:hypothetical protein